MTGRIARVALAVAVPAFLLAVPALAQENRGGGGGARAGGGARGGGGAGGGAVGGSGGGGSATSSGGGGSSTSGASGGSGGGSGWSGGAVRSEGDGGRRGATGGGGVAIADRGSRAGGSSTGGSSTGGGGSAVTRGSGGSATGAPGSARAADPGARGPRGVDGTPDYSRPRDGRTPIGTAVPRGSVPTTDRGGIGVFVPAGYYGGYYPGIYGEYDPYGGYFGGYYSGYYGGYYDPWYGVYPSYGQTTYSASADEGSLRLKIKPKEAEVYVDGFYAGLVDEFDGMFQRLHVEAGPHRIEVRAPGCEPLTFDVRITADHTTTYQGELKKIQ